ncbi:hypothetical protein EGI22_17855 [Lacihabitans sp. LS3-19]|uniref:hypothetical protein n=1 Tax=Lacihabitans sp. LS3-19 TaxID=2487335 RepID=UPI0020CDDF81|nr:hypothetical protein [Lacihabitans sp. LS3-19]MCP9769773.1 hypothetical protein [Lacihabitans sp. LS3-19]
MKAMKNEYYYLQLEGDYYYGQGDKKITFLINNKVFQTSKSNVIYVTEKDKQGNFTFLMKFTKYELARMTKATNVIFDIRPGFGTEFVKPKNPYPPSTISIRQAVRVFRG